MTRARLIAESIAAERAVNRALWDATLEDLIEVDITMAQFKALAAIQRLPDCTIGALSERLRIKPPATSLLVDKLVAAGLARRERDRFDGRRVLVHATPTGIRLSLLEKWIRQLPDDDLLALHRGTRSLASVAGLLAKLPSSQGLVAQQRQLVAQR